MAILVELTGGCTARRIWHQVSAWTKIQQDAQEPSHRVLGNQQEVALRNRKREYHESAEISVKSRIATHCLPVYSMFCRFHIILMSNLYKRIHSTYFLYASHDTENYEWIESRNASLDYWFQIYIRNLFKLCWKKSDPGLLWCTPPACLMGVTKTMKILKSDNRSPDLGLNPWPSEYEARLLSTRWLLSLFVIVIRRPITVAIIFSGLLPCTSPLRSNP